MKNHTVGVQHDVNSDVETELLIGTLHVDSVDPDESDWIKTLTINEMCSIKVGYRCSSEHY